MKLKETVHFNWYKHLLLILYCCSFFKAVPGSRGLILHKCGRIEAR